jgi:hypothetical protein
MELHIDVPSVAVSGLKRKKQRITIVNLKMIDMNRKRQILDHLINDLYDQYWEMIELAVESSNMEESKEVIDYIKSKVSE